MKTVVLAPACACGHNVADHDEIAARFCRATDAQGHARGCICTDLTSAIPVIDEGLTAPPR